MGVMLCSRRRFAMVVAMWVVVVVAMAYMVGVSEGRKRSHRIFLSPSPSNSNASPSSSLSSSLSSSSSSSSSSKNKGKDHKSPPPPPPPSSSSSSSSKNKGKGQKSSPPPPPPPSSSSSSKNKGKDHKSPPSPPPSSSSSSSSSNSSSKNKGKDQKSPPPSPLPPSSSSSSSYSSNSSSKNKGKDQKSPPPSPLPPSSSSSSSSNSSSKNKGKDQKSPPPSPPPPSSSSSNSSSKNKGKDHKSPPPSNSSPSSKNKGKDHKSPPLPPPPPPPPSSKNKEKGQKSPPPPSSSKGKGKGPKSSPPPPPSPSPSPKTPPNPTPTPSPSPSPSPNPPPSPSPTPGKGKDKGKGGGSYDYPSSNIFDVMSFGAQGDGQTDDTEAFIATWQKACQVEGAIVEVPAYFIFVVGPLMFSGPCQNHIVFQIDGQIIPLDADSWTSNNLLQWIGFSKVHSMVLQGEGHLDGKGNSWWSMSCKAKSPSGRRTQKSCDSPTAIRFYGSYDVTVRDLAIINSAQTHLKFDDCINVQVDNVTISSPYNSPNTDGIHIQNSQMVEIQNSFIQSGDDCISIQTGSSNIEIHDVNCGHGHGISIGGLGKGGTQACVSNVSVHDVFIKDSLNGVRIKTWQGASGSAKGITFSNINVQNISNPIVIDQFYCDAHSCRNQSSAVHVSGVTYNNIKGTYWYGQPIRLACSDSMPCTKISLSEIELVSMEHASATALSGPFCSNAYGFAKTSIVPPITCIQNGLPLSRDGKPLSDDDNC